MKKVKVIRGSGNVFKDIKCTKLETVKYSIIRFFKDLDMIWRKVYWFFQRGYRGYGDNDTWDLDDYLSTVIIGGVTQLKKYHHGVEPTKKQLQVIIDGFKANKKMMNYTVRPDSKEYIILKMKFHKGMDMLKKYFNYLWD